MPFGDMLMRDRITLVKKNGTVLRKDIPASVQSKKIFINDKTVPVEVDDHILRRLPSDLDEDFIVTEATFYDAGSLSHWEIFYRRSTMPAAPAQTIIHNITNNFSGPNARVNINSMDSSTNYAFNNSDAVFSDLIQTLRDKVDDDRARNELIKLVEEMRDAKGSEKFKFEYQRFMTSAANHMTVIAPFLPLLSQFL